MSGGGEPGATEVELPVLLHEMQQEERDAERIVAGYLANAPEQGEWDLPDHLDGLAGGLLAALRSDGFTITRPSLAAKVERAYLQTQMVPTDCHLVEAPAAAPTGDPA